MNIWSILVVVPSIALCRSITGRIAAAVNFSILKQAALALGLFAAVYAPAFACAALLRPPVSIGIPLVIVISAAMACLIIGLRARDTGGVAAFGIRQSPRAYVVAGAAAGLFVGIAFAWLTARYPAPAPFDLSKLRPWMIAVYFVMAAPIQEELIFRGLLQTTIARGIQPAVSWARHFPVVFVAFLFGLVHIESGAVVAVEAVLLGLIAGELRRLSGSLGPAILFHALLNGTQALWPA